MRKLPFILIALLLASPCLAQEQVARMSLAVVGSSGAAAAGPNAWYYSCTATPATEPTWDAGVHEIVNNTSVFFIPITIPSGGTLTKLSIKAAETYAEHVKLALYSAADPATNLSASGTTGTFVNETWIDATLGTTYSVSSGSYYVGIIADANSFAKKIGSGGYFLKVGQTYADFPLASYTTLSPLSDSCVAVRAFVQ